MDSPCQVTQKPDKDSETPIVMSELPFPDLPEKALEITNGVLPTGMTFPLKSDQPLDYETACKVTRRVTEVLQAMEAGFWSKHADPSSVILQPPAVTMLARSKLNILIVQSLINQRYPLRRNLRRHLEGCKKAVLIVTKMKRRLNNAYMVSTTLNEDVFLIKQMRSVEARENKMRPNLKKAIKMLKLCTQNLKAQEQQMKHRLTQAMELADSLEHDLRQVKAVEASNGC
ncbi:hypothetical protein DL546_009355 [Coniochaeta pulveracea]|uniref:Uncharacterized protein n=1 Tax=Coniochaeta pulveracea TaxID=177199 RepID=A0A420YP07_9PEZI|nr:hypothetical protein DL546_009355 [Coniochaeta pulveracea]